MFRKKERKLYGKKMLKMAERQKENNTGETSAWPMFDQPLW